MRCLPRTRTVVVVTTAVLAVALAVTASAAERKVLMEYFNATW